MRLPIKAETAFYNGLKFYRYPESRNKRLRYFSRGGDYLHRIVYEDNFGPIAPGLHIHHKDGDITNNAPSNLEALTHAEHMRRHPKPRSVRAQDMVNLKVAIAVATVRCHEPERKRTFAGTIKKMWANREPRTIVCVHCGAGKLTSCMKPVLYCSTRCKQAFKRKG